MQIREIKYEDPDYDPHRHAANIDQLTLARVPRGSRILDIGAATGYIGGWLQSNASCTVIGVEYSPEQAERARQRLTDVIVGNVETAEIQAQISAHAPFDVVTCSATIVCIVDPWALLRQIKTWLKPDGKLLITCANVAHWTMRRDLLRGKWDYQDYGVLDQLAVRFFTVASFRRALQEAGYTITDFDAEFYDMGLRVLARRLKLHRFERWYVRRFAGFFAIQFLYEAKPS
jgi:protein-L-isoaspartate O-methyltransferase